jgi:DNA-binding NtrC family response regulator
MNHTDKKRLFLLGLDERLLWQLTRTLATAEDNIEYYCASSLTEASELIRQKEINLIVVDGAEEGNRVVRSLSNHNNHPLPRLLVLTEESFQSLPQEMLLPDDTLFLEKPFNPKEFPFFVLKALERSVSYSPPQQHSDESKPDTGGDFYHYFNEGFSCLSHQDLAGARENWLRALSLKPGDRKVQANLARLEKMIKR